MIAMSASALGHMPSGEACTPGTKVELKWNAHASEWGAYTITGCGGVNPKLSIAAGVEYTFDQSDQSNWRVAHQLLACDWSKVYVVPAAIDSLGFTPSQPVIV